MRVLRLTTLRGNPPHRAKAASDSPRAEPDATISLWDWAKQAAPMELRTKLVGPMGEVLRDWLVASSASEQLGLRDSAGLHRAIARLLRAAEAVTLPVTRSAPWHEGGGLQTQRRRQRPAGKLRVAYDDRLGRFLSRCQGCKVRWDVLRIHSRGVQLAQPRFHSGHLGAEAHQLSRSFSRVGM